ncbi:acyl-CoA dehydrogenase family protein [Sphingosinithalassobacter portus]|uniref:acyl-CoA dehydrogenase family protein n=1 Tax=Stakelama portus TaxID=2676234 RepID=UPI000D6E13CF|nr:acyl-CoA dehydrogenase [Sphingosinithalassobacter portus]
MNFDLDEEQELLRASASRLFEDHAQAGQDDAAAQWRDYCDMGLIALPFPAAVGGLDGGHEAVMLVMDAYGAALARQPYLQPVLLAGRVLAQSEGELAASALAGLLDGSRRAALCLYEPRGRYRWELPQTSALRTGEGWTLRGEKRAVLDADGADLLLCPASVRGGVALFAVPVDAPGVTLSTRRTPDGRSASDVVFADVALGTEAMIADHRSAGAAIAAAVDGATAACCAEMVGAMDRLLAITVDYINTREQFGQPIGAFQALQHRAADMLVAIEQARSMVYYAVAMLDAEPAQRKVAVAAAKALVNRSARFVGTEAIQLHGGMGLASEYPAGRYFQRLTTLETMFGDTDHLLGIVETAGGLPD